MLSVGTSFKGLAQKLRSGPYPQREGVRREVRAIRVERERRTISDCATWGAKSVPKPEVTHVTYWSG